MHLNRQLPSRHRTGLQGTPQAVAALAPQCRQIAQIVVREHPAGRSDVGRDLLGLAGTGNDRTHAVLRCQPRQGELENRVSALTREGLELGDLGMVLVRNLSPAENSVHESVRLEP